MPRRSGARAAGEADAAHAGGALQGAVQEEVAPGHVAAQPGAGQPERLRLPDQVQVRGLCSTFEELGSQKSRFLPGRSRERLPQEGAGAASQSKAGCIW